MEYRRQKGNNRWHFCKNCQNWPTKDYVEYSGNEDQPQGDFCDECLKKQENNNCNS